MYRDERAAYLSRLETARRDLGVAQERVHSQLELIGVLSDQLKAQGLEAPNPPEATEPAKVPTPHESADAAELARAAGEIEQEVRRLQERGEALHRVSNLLNRRVRGESVALPLSEPPRSVPLLYLLAELTPHWFAFPFLGVASVVPLDGGTDAGLTTAAVLVVLAIFGTRAFLRFRFLGRCRETTTTEIIERGSDGSKLTNWPLRVSSGWNVKVENFSGSGTKHVVEFLTHEAETGRVTVKGSGYQSGVILYDPETLKAYDVRHFKSCPRPDANGRWVNRVPVRQWVGIAFVVLLGGTWLSPLARSLLP